MSADLHQKVSYLPDIQRLLPQSPDAEMGLLSSFLLASQEIGNFCAERNITPEHFHLPHHAEIYATLRALWTDGKPIDFITLTQVLRDTGKLDGVGGPAFITELFTFLPTAANVGEYVEIVEEKRTLREIIKVCTEYASRSYDEQDDPNGLRDELTVKVCALATNVTATAKPKTPKEIVLEATDRQQDRVAKRGRQDNVMISGIKGIDDAMGGIRPADYVLISGKEKSGKTSLAFNIFEHIVFQQNKRAMVISLEMKTPDLADRFFASMGRISLSRILNGWIEAGEVDKFTEAGRRIALGKFQWRDDVVSIGQAIAAIRQYKGQFSDLEIAFVDYLQMIEAEKKKDKNRELEIAEMSRALRRLANELNIGIVVLIQLNEDGQVRESRSPGMDCTAHIRIEPGKTESEKWARIVYQRNGPSNVGVPLTHLGQFLRFEQGTEREETPESKRRRGKRRWDQE